MTDTISQFVYSISYNFFVFEWNNFEKIQSVMQIFNLISTDFFLVYFFLIAQFSNREKGSTHG